MVGIALRDQTSCGATRTVPPICTLAACVVRGGGGAQIGHYAGPRAGCAAEFAGCFRRVRPSWLPVVEADRTCRAAGGLPPPPRAAVRSPAGLEASWSGGFLRVR